MRPSSRNNDLIRDLISRPDLDPNTFHDGRTALYRACLHGLDAAAIALIDCRRVDVNMLGNAGATPMEMASFVGSEAIVRRLLQRPDLDMGVVPEGLALAQANGHESIVAILRGLL